MRIYFINPVGSKTPMLFDTMVSTFLEQGHEIVREVGKADICFFDVHGMAGEFDMDCISSVIKNKIKVAIFDDVDYGNMSDKNRWFWFRPTDAKDKYESILSDFVNECSVTYFMRKMDRTSQYPEWVYPYELIQYPDHDFPPTTKEELFNRPYDICFIGNTSPTRENVCTELSTYFKCDFILGQTRVEHDAWLNRARQAKMFLTADGGGFTEERPYQLITIAPMLRQRNNHLQSHPFKDGINCWEVDEHPTRFDIEDLQLLLSEPDTLFDIYISGIEHMKKYYSAEYRANYILKTLHNNAIY